MATLIISILAKKKGTEPLNNMALGLILEFTPCFMKVNFIGDNYMDNENIYRDEKLYPSLTVHCFRIF